MAELLFYNDIIEKNGKTIKENNLAEKHKYKIGSLVEFDDGERLYIMKQTRDCDGSPLYSLGFNGNKEILCHAYGEESLKLIKETQP